MNAKAQQKPPEGLEKPEPSPPPPPPLLVTGKPIVGESCFVETKDLPIEPELPHPMLCVSHGGSPACEEANRRNGMKCPACGIDERHRFTVRVPLVCPHCSSYMRVLASGRTMTCDTERCQNHLKKFRLPVLFAEEVVE